MLAPTDELRLQTRIKTAIAFSYDMLYVLQARVETTGGYHFWLREPSAVITVYLLTEQVEQYDKTQKVSDDHLGLRESPPFASCVDLALQTPNISYAGENVRKPFTSTRH